MILNRYFSRKSEGALINSRAICAAALLIMIACQPLLAHTHLPAHPTMSPLPDLRIKKFLSPGNAPQKVKVFVANIGHLDSAKCVLRLTVRKINGVSVGRTTEIKVPALAAGKAEWVVIDAASILPKSVALNDTTFRLDVDPDDLVDEVNEDNNRVWYNL
jgi:hypothetical protein